MSFFENEIPEELVPGRSYSLRELDLFLKQNQNTVIIYKNPPPHIAPDMDCKYTVKEQFIGEMYFSEDKISALIAEEKKIYIVK